MFNFFIISLSLYLIICGGKENNKKSKDCSNISSYPSGYELKNELRTIPIYDYDISNLNFESIENYVFRDYVYNFEKNRRIYKRNSLKKSFR